MSWHRPNAPSSRWILGDGHERDIVSGNSNTRVLIVTWLKSGYGGAQKYLMSLMGSLQSEGFEVHCALNDHNDNDEFRRAATMLDVVVHLLPMRTGSPKIAARQLDRVVETVGPDLIHYNAVSRQTVDTALSARCFRRRICRKLLTMHLGLVSEKSAEDFSTNPPLPLSYEWRRLRRRRQFAHCFDKITSVSLRNARLVETMLSVRGGSILYIPNGVDTDTFFPGLDHPKRAKRSVVVGWSGRLDSQKRLDLLLRAVESIASQIPVEVRLAGAGPELEPLSGLARELGICDRVTFLGRADDMPAFLQVP